MYHAHPHLLHLAMLVAKQGCQMSSSAKIASNRENARRSTGPRTELGRNRSRHNAVKHGIYATAPLLRGEDAFAYRALEKSLQEHFAPDGPVEVMLVQQMITEAWKVNRIQRAENGFFDMVAEGNLVKFFHSLEKNEMDYVKSRFNLSPEEPEREIIVDGVVSPRAAPNAEQSERVPKLSNAELNALEMGLARLIHGDFYFERRM